MRTINEVLQQKGPHFNYIDRNATVLEAILVMKSENISYLIVNENGNYAGIISERDYTHKVILENKQSANTLVKEIMTKDFPIISSSNTADQCMVLMNASKTRYLPVFDEMEFKGIITIHDLMREAILQNEKSSESMKAALTDKSLKFY
ncbi:MAG TPA: CBS domain-containing protein [Panacibacter sp.]|nr:CBS domain-containing protein [Panacibacter sp.]